MECSVVPAASSVRAFRPCCTEDLPVEMQRGGVIAKMCLQAWSDSKCKRQPPISPRWPLPTKIPSPAKGSR